MAEAGRDALEACDRGADALEEHMLRDVGPDDAAALHRALTACASGLGAFTEAAAAHT
ncbi:hypothetical protein [Streptomonospora litoralis]|uniref:hypothetical protein n=1 Tax=Streptomonospora litoralis TaxID=2498135 RepID=UPI0013F1524C|nr:hypothetical protein [Streptomonospora litoralis]